MNAKMSMIDYAEAILSATDQGVFLVDSQDKVYHANAELLDMLGMKKLQVVGWTGDDLIRWLASISCDPQHTERELKTTRDSLEQRASVYFFSERESTMVRFQIQLFRLPQSGPKPYSWGGLVRDVTTEWQESTNQTRYAALITRELQLPLAEVKGMLATHIQNCQLWTESERQRVLGDIYKGIDHSTHLLKDLQDLFRIQTGGLSLDRQPTDMNALIRKAFVHKAPQLAAHQLTEDLSGDLPTVECDENKVEQVLATIIDSLLGRSPAGSKVSFCAQSEGKEIILSFTGHSIQVPDAQIPWLFGPLNAETLRKVEQGKEIELGLHIAYEFVIAHGGRMWANNSPGHGLTIYLTLPIAGKQPVPVETPRPRLVQKPQPVTHNIPSDKLDRTREAQPQILLVEDDFELARLLTLVLERQQYRVLTAERGAQALEIVAAKKPDLVLLDLQLPDTDGLKVCKELREFTDTPIIILTANPKREDIAQALDMGADDYVTKPFNKVELGARIRANLGRVIPRGAAAQNNAVFAVRDLEIDFDKRQVTIRGQRIKLTPTEYKVLYHLAINPGQVLTHEQLLSKVWGAEFHDATQYLWVCISRLRKKLEIDPTNPRYLLTEQGVGYYVYDESGQ